MTAVEAYVESVLTMRNAKADYAASLDVAAHSVEAATVVSHVGRVQIGLSVCPTVCV